MSPRSNDPPTAREQEDLARGGGDNGNHGDTDEALEQAFRARAAARRAETLGIVLVILGFLVLTACVFSAAVLLSGCGSSSSRSPWF